MPLHFDAKVIIIALTREVGMSASEAVRNSQVVLKSTKYMFVSVKRTVWSVQCSSFRCWTWFGICVFCIV